MDKKNFFRLIVSTLFIVTIIFFNAVTHAEIYIGEGSYSMCEFETLGIAKERSKAVAVRNAVEKFCPYVKTYALTKNFNLDSASVEFIAVNVIKLIDEPQFNIENMMIRVTVNAQIDDCDIERLLNMNIYENVIQYKALRRAEVKQTKLIAELKRQSADNPDDKEIIAQKFAEADKIFLSHQKLHEALKLYNKGNYKGTIRLCNEAIELNPTYNFSYNNRALALIGLGHYDEAIKDFETSIKLHAACFNAYNNRGAVYRHLNQYEKAIDDHNNAIRIKPDSEDSYLNRGIDYYCLNDYEQAIRDFDKAIELNPNYADAYYNRGLAYQKIGAEEKAFADFVKAEELGYKAKNF
ncbi:MAG: tetratricopeptide repeat protein [Selenomonadaceae bacterium]|nr:tetratricopeptide repeat protein [Selenomonadaceae bacterium]